jgi:hypothetical protein
MKVPVKKKYKERKRQYTRKSCLVRSGLGNRSLQKYRIGYKVLENCISTRQEKSMYRHSKKNPGHLLPYTEKQATVH